MTSELLWVLCGGFVLLIGFLSFLIWFTLSTVRTAHREQVESLRADQKSLHSLLRQTQDRIHASSLNDYLTLRAHDNGTDMVDGPPQNAVLSRSDAVEAEISANRIGVEVP